MKHPQNTNARDKTTTALAANLREVLDQKGMNRSDLQRAMGAATSSAVYDFLSGRTRSIKVETLSRLSEALDVPVAQLLSERPDQDDADADLDTMDRPALLTAARAMRAAIRAHRDATGHDLCWHHPEMWALLPDPPRGGQVVPDWPQFLRGCIAYRTALERELPEAQRIQKEFKA